MSTVDPTSHSSHLWSAVPSKRYFKIGEVSQLCGVKPHVVRYWEQVFPMLQPVKHGKGQRLFRQEDIQILRQIKWLLHTQGLTVEGAKKYMKANRAAKQTPDSPVLREIKTDQVKACLTALLADLDALLHALKHRD